VTLGGPRTILDAFDENDARLVVEIGQAPEGAMRIDLRSARIVPELARRLDVVRIQPARLRIRLDRVARRRVPVALDLVGEPAFGYTVAESMITPDQIDVVGPAREVEGLTAVRTEPVNLTGISGGLDRAVRLRWIGDFVSLDPDRVRLALAVEEVMTSREFKRVRVRLPTGEEARTEPAVVDIAVEGPGHLLHNFKIPPGTVTVDPSAFAVGVHDVPVRVALPDRLTVTKVRPPEVRIEIPGETQAGASVGPPSPEPRATGDPAPQASEGRP